MQREVSFVRLTSRSSHVSPLGALAGEQRETGNAGPEKSVIDYHQSCQVPAHLPAQISPVPSLGGDTNDGRNGEQ